jgi:hypothetical protein
VTRPRGARASAPWLISLAWLALASRPARADSPDRVLLVAPPAGLAPAVRTALSAWPIEILVIGDEPGGAGAAPHGAPPAGEAPGATMPSSAERARALAVRHRAGAVVWMSDDGQGGHALWIYDAESGHTTTRRLIHPPPFDEPTAAAAALTVKTLLRHSSVVPLGERVPQDELSPPAAPRLAIETSGGARTRRAGARGVEPRVAIGLRVAPGALAELGAVAAGVHMGPGVRVDRRGFTGRFTDLQISSALLARIGRGRLAFWPQVGASLHFTEIDGAIRGRTERARVRRLNPTADAGAALELAVRPWLRASVGGSASWALRRQTYLVTGKPVLSLPRLEIELGAAVSVPLR